MALRLDRREFLMVAGATAVTTSYPSGTQLFAHQQTAQGLFIVSSGRVNLFAPAGQDKTVSFGVAGPGDILGLTATISGKRYHANAEVLEPCEIKFIPRTQLLGFLAKHGEAALRVIGELCECFDQTLSELTRKGFSITAPGRFARFPLEYPPELDERKDELCIKLPLTHKKMAQIIGVRRETLSRIVNDFKKKKLIQVKGETVIIRSRATLELIAKL